MKHIPDEAWNNFKKQFVLEDICDIAQGLVSTLILIVPKAQINTFRSSSKYKKMITEYYNLINQYTDEKISKPEDITVFVESKEEFDIQYRGSWYNYFS
jgi:hypothetical protein